MFDRLNKWSDRLTPPMKGDFLLLTGVLFVGHFLVAFSNNQSNQSAHLLADVMLGMSLVCFYVAVSPERRQRLRHFVQQTNIRIYTSLFLLPGVWTSLALLLKDRVYPNALDQVSAVVHLGVQVAVVILLLGFLAKDAWSRRRAAKKAGS